MIYDYPSSDSPIRQGDIFLGLPRLVIGLKQLPILSDDGPELRSWAELSGNREPIEAIVSLRSVNAIVISQDCDTTRAPDISFCEIGPFQEIERKSAQTSSPKKWASMLTQQARINQKWFYLPPDSRLKFETKMAVNYMVTFCLPREDIESILHLRTGRLNDVAAAHFRERIAEFFRRYPYDEWYPLNQEELTEYIKDHSDTVPFPWQMPPQPSE
jgi:hypothetical protein